MGVSCDASGKSDEIGHLTLIPAGPHAGRIMVWTAFDARAPRLQPPNNCPYQSHIIDPTTWTVVASQSFDPALPSLAEGPFCAGHAWMTDLAGNPKLLLAGGIENDGICGGPMNPCPSTEEAYWFDPLTVQWSDGPDELPEGTWYPSVITFLDPTLNAFRPIAVGGSTTRPPQDCPGLFKEWWTFSNATNAWTTHVDPSQDLYWGGYPRTFFLAEGTNPYWGEVLAAGHDEDCESPAPYGGSPSNRIKTGDLPTNTWLEGPDPNDIWPNDDHIWAWNSNHGAMLHTLKPGWSFTTDANAAIAQYDLNRVIMTGGTREEPDPGELQNEPAYPWTVKYTGSGWELMNQPDPRVFANFTLLPDGKILLLGGQSSYPRGGPTIYWTVPKVFDPGDPITGAGTWTDMAEQPPFAAGQPPTPRGYHSVAILLPDGSVALVGGLPDGVIGGPLEDSEPADSIDHFQPPYFFNGVRPVMSEVPQTIHYGSTFNARVLLGAQNPPSGGPPGPSTVRFCLMGIGSVTHHFDYGQRYVELMYETLPNGKKRVLAPPKRSMAPDGYYMLFVVDSLGRPSLGKFVRLTY